MTDTSAGGSWSATNSNASVSASGVVTGSTIGIDTIKYTVTNSCGSAIASRVISVNAVVTSSVSIGVNPDSVICTGDPVTFNATPINGGSAPHISWMRSGTYASTGPAYSYSPANGDAVSCELISSDVCASHDTVGSNTITMTVNPVITPITTISASPNDTVAFVGQLITFSTSLIFCGPSPIYQWFLNGTAIAGATNATYAMNVFSDVSVFCIVSCNMACVTTSYNHSNTIVVSSIPLAINDEQMQISDLTLYPNPASSEFYVDGRINNEPGTRFDFEVLDMPGRVLFHEPGITQNGIIHQKIHPDSTLPPGSYFLRIFSDAGVKMIRFVVMD